MRLDRAWHRKRRAMAGIVATVFMFAMLFSVGASYFLFVNQNDLLYSQAAAARATALSGQHGENLVIVGEADPATNLISFTAQDLGATTATITAFFVMENNQTILAFCQAGTGGSCPLLPVSVNQGMTSNNVDTGVTYTSPNTYTISVVTQLGNVFTANYPPSAISLASQALSSGAIGDLYLSFQSYRFYKVSSGSGCPNGSPYSGYCLTDEGQAFAIDHSLMSSGYDMAFSIQINDLNGQQANIVLDPYTLLSLVPESGKGSLSYTNWFIVSNKTTGGFNAILSSYTPVVLKYNVPVTVVFASGASLYGSSFVSGDLQPVGQIAGGTTTPIFIVSHGCEGVGITSCSISNANYGQNSPYVTTLFY